MSPFPKSSFLKNLPLLGRRGGVDAYAGSGLRPLVGPQMLRELFRSRVLPEAASEGKMFLTKCAACAIELGTGGKECGRCQTRYCGAACQVQHWEEGGHDQLCKSIKRAGGAEQFYANTKYTEAVAVAAEACADDTEGQTCYICLEDDSEEGLVRGCSCRGAAGVAHVSCLARQAQVAAERTFDRWHTCGLCEQTYHGVVRCALGWACWKTYVGRPETDAARQMAMTQLSNGLFYARHYEDALTVYEAELAMDRRLGADEDRMLTAQGNLASSYYHLGQLDEALRRRRDVYSGRLKLSGEEHEDTLRSACNYANSLDSLKRSGEAKSLFRKTIPVARRVLGESNELTLLMRLSYADTLHEDPGAWLDELREAVTTLEDTASTARRVLGGAHPLTKAIGKSLRGARAELRAYETALAGRHECRWRRGLV